MNSNRVRRDIADDAATDVRCDFMTRYGHHWNRCGGRQPEGLVVATGIVADVVEVTEYEWHRVESS